jgi:hypothetical protein
VRVGDLRPHSEVSQRNRGVLRAEGILLHLHNFSAIDVRDPDAVFVAGCGVCGRGLGWTRVCEHGTARTSRANISM